MQRAAWLQTSAYQQRASLAHPEACSMPQRAGQRFHGALRAAAWQCRSHKSWQREGSRKAHRARWPEAVVGRPRRAGASVIVTAAAAAAADSGDSAQQSLPETRSSQQPQRLKHSRQSQQWSPGFGRLLWQQLAPDWWKLLCVAAFTFVSVVATVSVGPAVGRGPCCRIAPRAHSLLRSGRLTEYG